MNPKRHVVLAALLAAVTLSAPGVALAGGGNMPVDLPMPVPAPEERVIVPLAEVKVTREEAIAAATKMFIIPADMGEPNVNISQSKALAYWELNWRTPAKKPNARSITVSVNAITGKIMAYHTSSAVQPEAPLTYSRSQAFRLAAEWQAKLVPDQKEALRYVDNPLEYGFWGGNAAFQFHWDRMEKGYPVAGDGVDITIDARTGELQSFNLAWRSDLSVSLPKTILSQEKAEAAYQHQLPMQMLYRYYQKPATDKGEWKLVYRPFNTSYPMVNQEGKLIDYSGAPIDFARWSDLKLVPAAEKPYEKPAKPLTHEEALAKALALAGRKDTPNNIDCREEGEEQKRQSCHFSWYDEVKGGTLNIQVDMVSGLVVSYGNWENWATGSELEKPQAKFSAEQAKAIAIEFIRQNRPDLAGKALVAPNRDYEEKLRLAAGETVRSYYFQFLMTRDYIPVHGREASVEVDAFTGAVRYFYGYMLEENTKEPFPALEGLIKQSDAIASFLTNQGLELTWVTFNSAEPYPVKGKPEGEAEPVTTLVWSPRRVFGIDMIDARTGVPYDYSGRDLIEAAKRPTDIDGHFAQREIELLWARGIFELKDGKFNPDQTTTAAELARWLVLARGLQPYMAYDFAGNFAPMGKGVAAANLSQSTEAAYFGAALQAGILIPEDFTDDADPNAPVSRELYALWVMRALGYGEIAKMESRIEMPYADKAQIGGKYANSAALLYGLKITRGDAGGKFSPQRSVNRGEAAQWLFAVASKGYSYWR